MRVDRLVDALPDAIDGPGREHAVRVLDCRVKIRHIQSYDRLCGVSRVLGVVVTNDVDFVVHDNIATSCFRCLAVSRLALLLLFLAVIFVNCLFASRKLLCDLLWCGAILACNPWMSDDVCHTDSGGRLVPEHVGYEVFEAL